METKQLQKQTFDIEGMHCAGCANSTEEALKKLEGVTSVNVNIATEKATVEFDPELTGRDDFKKAVESAGYQLPDNTENQTYDIEGMHCAGCAQSVEKALNNIDGVASANVNLATEKASIKFQPDETGFERFRQAVEDAGYTLLEPAAGVNAGAKQSNKVEKDQRKVDDARKKMWWAWGATIPAMLWMLPEMLAGYEFLGPFSYDIGMILLSSIVIFYPGLETLKSAWKSALNGTPNMDVLIAMGTLASLATGFVALGHHLGMAPEFHSFAGIAGMIMAFHLTGRYIETKAKGRASEAIKKLLTLEAKEARIIRNGQEMTVAISDLKKEDIMIVKPGEKIPTDGVIVDGQTTIDESIATGESMPVKKSKGDEVIGATINKNGAIRVKATKLGKDTFLNQVIRMVEEAQGSKIPVQEFADRIVGIFVPVVLVVAGSTLALWLLFPGFFHEVAVWGAAFLPWINPGMGSIALAFYAAIAVLVIACPCALGLATPTALMVGSGKGAENGILIRNGAAIQRMRDVSTIVLDKTGTITKGQPGVTDIMTADLSYPEKEIARIAASVEQHSEHPLGEAIVNKAKENEWMLDDTTEFEAITGKGVKAVWNDLDILVGTQRLMNENSVDVNDDLQKELKDLENAGKTAMLVAVDNQLAGIIAVADTIKADSKAAIQKLKEFGIEPVMITGDNERTARAVAEEVGIQRVIAGVLPDQKSSEIQRLQEKGEVVAMVGDGINDAPALTQADVGLAIGSGTDVAIESGDIVLVKGDLSAAEKAVSLSRATFTKIKQNLFWAFFYNVVMVPLAILGMMHPVLAEMAMAFSSINVVFNSSRLKKVDLS